MAQTTLISSIERSVYYPTEYILSSPYRCGTFSLIVDTGTWTEQMYYELPCLQLDIYTTISGVDVKYLSCNITLDTDNPMEPYTVSLYEVPETFKVKLTPGFDNDAVTSHKALCNQLNIPNTWVEETTDFNCELIWDNDNIKSGGGGTVDEVARSSIATHTSRTDNPHNVNKAQVGLGSVANVDTSTTANIADTSLKRFVSDTEKTMWGIQKNERPGITWTSVSTVANEWYDCAFGNGRFVVVSPTGTNRVGISVDGTNWNTYAVPTFDFRAIAFGNGVFVAVANVGTNRVMYSVDGITWTSVTVPLNTWWSITYGNGLFVATAMAGTNKVMYSTNGVNWTPVVAPSEIGEIRDITYGNGLFLAVARTGTHRVMYSTDAITWTPVVVSISNWNGIAFGNGRFVVVANSGDNRVMYSTDGINWTPVVVNLTQWLDVTYGNGLFVAVGEDTGNRSMYSLDAVTWYYNIIPTSNWRKVIYVDNMFMAFASSGTIRIMSSGSYLYLDKVRVVKKSVIGEVTATILSTEWTGTGPFEDTAPVVIAGEQITNTTYDIKVSLVLSSDINIAKQEQEAYSYFSKGEISATNTLKITCFEYKPTVNLNLTLEVVKKW